MSFRIVMIGSLLLFGCGDKGSTSDDLGGNADGGDDGGISPDVACTDLATARCMKRSMCSDGASITRVYGTMQVCVAREKLSCVNGLAAQMTGRTTLQVEQCAQAWPAQSCTDFFLGTVPTACVVTGTLPDIASCAFSGQCMSGLCGIPRNVQCGTCLEPPMVGAACPTGICAPGQNCANSGACVVEGAMGAKCLPASSPCGPGLSCVGSNAAMMIMGTCQTQGTMAGTTCDTKDQTAPTCDATLGFACNAMTKKCDAIVYADPGKPCGTMMDGSHVECSGSGLCSIPAMMTIGTCIAPATDGAACDTSTGPPCLSPARCILTGGDMGTSGTCQLNLGPKC
jgi:hypothetical protein